MNSAITLTSAQGCQDGVGMHTHETHCSTLGVLAVVLASCSFIRAGVLYQEPHVSTIGVS